MLKLNSKGRGNSWHAPFHLKYSSFLISLAPCLIYFIGRDCRELCLLAEGCFFNIDGLMGLPVVMYFVGFTVPLPQITGTFCVVLNLSAHKHSALVWTSKEFVNINCCFHIQKTQVF